MQRALPLVHVLVSDLAARLPRSVPRDDLESAGMLGLVQAAGSWDPSRGVAFEAFARARIKGALLDELRARDWASRSVRSEARREQAAVDSLAARLGRPPTSGEVAEHLGVPVEHVTRLRDDVARADVASLDAMVVETSSEPAIDDQPAEAVLGDELRAVLAAAIDSLPERLRHVVREYFFAERPMLEIAEELGVTESRISQMRAEAIALLRDGVDSQLDPERVPDLHVTTGRVGRRKSQYYAAVATRFAQSA